MDTNILLRSLPKTDEVLAHPVLTDALATIARPVVVDAVRASIDAARAGILAGRTAEYTIDDAARDAAGRAVLASRPSLRRVINATGIIVHTNLGRSVLSEAAMKAVADVSAHYSTLEYDVESGERGSRHVHCEQLICKLTGAEAAMAVNNNAAAVMMGIAALARGKEAIVSRGELVEIGGSFRVPDIMAESGATMVEIGTTNKTHLRDYENAITERTGLMLKVHTSNYRVVGFTAGVDIPELVELGASHGIPVMEDQGSGVLVDLRKYGLPYEPTVGESVAKGASLVTCSGDKLLGGPQAGILCGRFDVIQRLKKHPMARALRLDKMTLAALEATLRAYLDEERATREIPTLRMLALTPEESRAMADDLARRVAEAVGTAAGVEVAADVARAGGGALPITDISSFAVAVAPSAISVAALETQLRLGAEPAIIGRVKDGRLLLDPRTILGAEESAVVVERLRSVLGD